MDEKLLRFKEKMDGDENFRKLFTDAYNLDEIIDIARENGYDLDMDEIMDDAELSDQFLEAVAGGKDNTYSQILYGNSNVVFKANSKEEAQKNGEQLVEKLQENGICGSQ